MTFSFLLHSYFFFFSNSNQVSYSQPALLSYYPLVLRRIFPQLTLFTSCLSLDGWRNFLCSYPFLTAEVNEKERTKKRKKEWKKRGRKKEKKEGKKRVKEKDFESQGNLSRFPLFHSTELNFVTQFAFQELLLNYREMREGRENAGTISKSTLLSLMV